MANFCTCVVCGHRAEDGFFDKHGKVCVECASKGFEFCPVCFTFTLDDPVSEYEVIYDPGEDKSQEEAGTVECCSGCFDRYYSKPLII